MKINFSNVIGEMTKSVSEEPMDIYFEISPKEIPELAEMLGIDIKEMTLGLLNAKKNIENARK